MGLEDLSLYDMGYAKINKGICEGKVAWGTLLLYIYFVESPDSSKIPSLTLPVLNFPCWFLRVKSCDMWGRNLIPGKEPVLWLEGCAGKSDKLGFGRQFQVLFAYLLWPWISSSASLGIKHLAMCLAHRKHPYKLLIFLYLTNSNCLNHTSNALGFL